MQKVISQVISFVVLVIIVAAIQYYRPWQNQLPSVEHLHDQAQSWSKEFDQILPILKQQGYKTASQEIAELNRLIAQAQTEKEHLKTFDFLHGEYLAEKIKALQTIKSYLGGEPLALEEYEAQKKAVLAKGWNCDPKPIAIAWRRLKFWSEEAKACDAYQAKYNKWRAAKKKGLPLPTFDPGQIFEKLKSAWETRFHDVDGIRHQILPAIATILKGFLAVIFFVSLWRSLFFFVLAPKVRHWRGLRPCAHGAGRVNAQLPVGVQARFVGSVSSPSLQVTLGRQDELHVRHAYLQSYPTDADVTSTILFDWRMPISSLASHLFDLTRIRPRQAPINVVVTSSGEHAIGELAVIEVPEGSSLVVKPRSLIGVIKPIQAGSRITREWKLHEWMAWLTLKLRFVVVHGPIKVVLKGHRGLRMESVVGGRAISRNAVIAFSANLEVQPTRAEPFWQYLNGNQGLFNDRYSGDVGQIVFEENVGVAGHQNVLSRNIGRIYDTVLTLFGV